MPISPTRTGVESVRQLHSTVQITDGNKRLDLLAVEPADSWIDDAGVSAGTSPDQELPAGLAGITAPQRGCAQQCA